MRSLVVSILLTASIVVSQMDRFEVASVKATPPDRVGYTSLAPLGTDRLSATNVTLELLIGMAFGLQSDYLRGSPSWLEMQHYDVEARMPGGEKLTADTVRRPLQALLSERFKLATHRSTEERQGYALVVEKGGSKLQESSVPAKIDDSA